MAGTALGIGNNSTVTGGYALLQNLIEYTSASTTNLAFRSSGDSDVGNVTHLIGHHNTFAAR